MGNAKNEYSKHGWLFCSHKQDDSNRSPWLQSTLTELEEKAKAMLNIIQEDADSFAKRAEMYYKKRPELISMLEDLYKSHRSLAERYDRVKSEPQPRPTTPQKSLLSSSKYSPEKSLRLNDKAYDSYSEVYGLEMSDGSSEVDDPEEGQDTLQDGLAEQVSGGASNKEVMHLREELQRLREENQVQKEQLKLKDEEKREVIRQLTLSMELLREEKAKLRQCCLAKNKNQYKHNNSKRVSSQGWLFRGFARSHSQSSLVSSTQDAWCCIGSTDTQLV